MILFKFLVITWVILISSSKLKVRFYRFTKLGKDIEAKLQTATSSFEVYSIIYVHRLLDFIVPKFCW
jgi:hypothetical protein